MKKIIFILVMVLLIAYASEAGFNFTAGSYTIKQAESLSAVGNTSTTNYRFYFATYPLSANTSTTSYRFYLTPFYLEENPSRVTLYDPPDTTITMNRTQTLTWENANDTENDVLTYQIQVDNNQDFSSPEIDVSGIQETQPRTNHTPSSELEVDEVYYWRVRAYDGLYFGEYSSIRNFNIQSAMIISLPFDSVDFGNLKVGDKTDTTTNSPLPMVIQNDGNIVINLTVTGDDIWYSQPNPSSYYQFKIDVNESNSFTDSTSSFTDINQSRSVIDIKNLNYSDVNDAAEIELLVTTPSDESPGSKSSIITVEAE